MMLKTALLEVKKQLDYYIDNIEDLNDEDVINLELFLKTLITNCWCDDYVGFDCGCTRRNILYEDAIFEIENFKIK